MAAGYQRLTGFQGAQGATGPFVMDIQTMNSLQRIYRSIGEDPDNAWATALGYKPLYTASPHSRIIVVGQAPGRKAQESGIPWNDASGVRLRSWLGVSDEQFYDPDLISLLPMDFYYPGKGKSGDLPPRKGFAARWHPQIVANMKDLRLTILVGGYAQKYYLGAGAKTNLTATVQAYREYLPQFMPLVHPSPLNFRWHSRNPWFEKDLVPVLREVVKRQLD